MIFDPENGNKTRRKERKFWVTFSVWLPRVALQLPKGGHYCLSVSNSRCLFWIKSGAKWSPHWDRPKIPQKTDFVENKTIKALHRGGLRRSSRKPYKCSMSRRHRLARCGVMLALCLSGAGRCGFWISVEKALLINDSAVALRCDQNN